jgi:hypothetical protein
MHGASRRHGNLQREINRMANAPCAWEHPCSLQARTNTLSASCRRAGHPTRPVVALAYGQHRLPSPNSYVLLPPFRTADCAAQVRPCRASPRLCERERRKRGQLDKTLLCWELGPWYGAMEESGQQKVRSYVRDHAWRIAALQSSRLAKSRRLHGARRPPVHSCKQTTPSNKKKNYKYKLVRFC